MSESLASRLSRIQFSVSIPGADRIHYVNADDVRVVLGRLPLEFWARLRAVHFNDRARGARVLAYVNQGHREIAPLCIAAANWIDGSSCEGPDSRAVWSKARSKVAGVSRSAIHAL